MCWTNLEFVSRSGKLNQGFLSIRNNYLAQWFILPYSQNANLQASRFPGSILEDREFSMSHVADLSQPPVPWHASGTGPISMLNSHRLVFRSSLILYQISSHTLDPDTDPTPWSWCKGWQRCNPVLGPSLSLPILRQELQQMRWMMSVCTRTASTVRQSYSH